MPKSDPILKLETNGSEFVCYTYSLFYQVFWRYWEKHEIELYIPKKDRWVLWARRGISTECNCGLDYRTANGAEFKRAFPKLGLSKMEAVMDVFYSAALCERCYFLKEYQDPKRRHLVPTRWQEKFAQNY